jgi:hypothetical protein
VHETSLGVVRNERGRAGCICAAGIMILNKTNLPPHVEFDVARAIANPERGRVGKPGFAGL